MPKNFFQFWPNAGNMALYLVTVALTWLAPVRYIQKFFDPGTRIVKYGCWGFEVTLVSSLTSFHDSNLATVVWWATFIPIEDWSDLNHSVVNVVLGTHNCGILSMIKAHSFIYGYITTMVITLQQVQVKTSNSIKLVSTSPSSTLGNVPNWEMASHGGNFIHPMVAVKAWLKTEVVDAKGY